MELCLEAMESAGSAAKQAFLLIAFFVFFFGYAFSKLTLTDGQHPSHSTRPPSGCQICASRKQDLFVSDASREGRTWADFWRFYSKENSITSSTMRLLGQVY
jgi:hypothetical protein